MKPLSEKDIELQNQNEENTKLNYITPELRKKWVGEGTRIVMEYGGYYFTAGRIKVDEDDNVTRGDRKKVDYLLLFKANLPLALVEAKAITVDAGEGYSQAVQYAEMLDVPFAYACNGKDLIEIDMITGKNKDLKLQDFPTPDDLWDRYKEESNISAEDEEYYLQQYYNDGSGREPRYYQRIVINRAIDAIIKGQNRLLIVMATGTGKTYTAFQIMWRLWKSGLKKKILFLADRDILISQSMGNDFRPFGTSMYRLEDVNRKGIPTQYEIYLSLYHQLKLGEKENYKQLPRDFFDLIVIDECHRGSAGNSNPRDTDDEDSGNWHDILEYFSSATQIGLTATPKETEEVSNIDYFGKPIYTYSLKQGIEDGFLAPYKVIAVELDIDRDGYLPPAGKLDIDGNPVEQRLYTQKDFDRKIIVDERREIVARRISDFLKQSGNRYAKTIVFCEDTEHALAMKRLIENENSDLVAENPKYVMRITGNDEVGKESLEDFIAPNMKYPVIAVTSKLMSTGVDAQTTEVIVLDRTIGSMTEFKQIIGRGTRIKENYSLDGEKEKHSKTHFTILDFRKNYLQFKDPEFDGEPDSVKNLGEKDDFPKRGTGERKKPEIDNAKKSRLHGIDVEIVYEEVKYLDENGNLIRKENISNCVKNNITEQFATFDEFKSAWLKADKKDTFGSELLIDEDYVEKVKAQFNFTIDKFDIIAYLAYGIEPISKKERTEQPAVVDYVLQFNDEQQQVINLLLECYEHTNFDELRLVKIFNLPIFENKGWSRLKAVQTLGGKDKFQAIVNALENKLYE